MSAHDQTIGTKVSQRERAFLVEALELLMRERSNALRIATVVAQARGDRVPEVQDFGLDDILRLSRQIAEAPSASCSVCRSETPHPTNQANIVGSRKAFCQMSNQE
jgi:hypothetical protein